MATLMEQKHPRAAAHEAACADKLADLRAIYTHALDRGGEVGAWRATHAQWSLMKAAAAEQLALSAQGA